MTHNTPRRAIMVLFITLPLFLVQCGGCDESSPDADDGQEDIVFEDISRDEIVDPAGEDTQGEEAILEIPEEEAEVDGPAPECSPISEEIIQWLEEHQACDESTPCRWIENDGVELPSGDFCFSFAAPGDDIEALQTLTGQWHEEGCDLTLQCGVQADEIGCVEGTCQILPDPCAACDLDEVDPQCTVGGRNALNPCIAQYCLEEDIAHAGWCEDSAQCLDAGGTCVETFYYEPPCPSGSRWDVDDKEQGCPLGSVRGFCCIDDWTQPCEYYGDTNWGLSLDPFTCGMPTDLAWFCVNIDEQTACTMPATIAYGIGDPWNATLTVTSQPGYTATLTGENHDTGRTFTCTGSIPPEMSDGGAWDCMNCASDGTDCDDCFIAFEWACRL